MLTFVEVYKEYKEKHLVRSFRQLERDINAVLSPHGSVTAQGLNQYAVGKSAPNYWIFLYLYEHGSDWLRDFARDVLKSIKPNLWVE